MIVVDILTAEEAHRMAQIALRHCFTAEAGRVGTPSLSRLNRPPGAAPVSDAGEGRQGWVGDCSVVKALLPELLEWPLCGRLIAAACRLDVRATPGPWHRSHATLKVYGPGDGQGLHVDTNPITVLLLLMGEGGPETGHGVHPLAPGQALVFRGGDIPHRVRPASAWRVTVPLNFYTPDDMHRPDYADALVYGD